MRRPRAPDPWASGGELFVERLLPPWRGEIAVAGDRDFLDHELLAAVENQEFRIRHDAIELIRCRRRAGCRERIVEVAAYGDEISPLWRVHEQLVRHPQRQRPGSSAVAVFVDVVRDDAQAVEWDGDVARRECERRHGSL